MEVRALVTAKDADDVWTIRVTVREQMIRWLTEHHPYALPRVNMADAILPPGTPHSNGTDATPPRPGRRHAVTPPRTGQG
jgi:hypothetical protein